MKVRPAIKEDIEKLVEFQLSMAKETENKTLDVKTLKRGITAVLNDAQKARYFVATEDKEILGCFMVTPEWSDWRAGYFIWLQSVYVDPDHREKGVFNKMYTYLKDIVENNLDYIGIRLYVDSSNKSAIEVYKKAGLQEPDYTMFEWNK